jgi:serine protease DegQ
MYVVTNAHVIQAASDEPESLFVYSINGSKYEVKVVGGDSFYDIAVLQFVAPPGNEILSMDFRSTDLRIGEPVYAIGTPLGKYPYSVTDGIISGLNRFREGITGKFGFLQTTATVTWGNSGGPLIDTNGKVVGINSQIEIVTEGDEPFVMPQINFALEAKLSNRLIEDILNHHGFVQRAYLGVEVSQVYTLNRRTKMYEPRDTSPVLTGFIQNSPAARVLQSKIGSNIIKINGTTIRNTEEALGELEKLRSGEKAEMVLNKSGREETVSVQVGLLASDSMRAIAEFIIGQGGSSKFDVKEEAVYLETSRGSYRILAAGTVFDKDNQQIWMVKTLNDLAAAFRFSGLYGVIDFYYSQDPSSNEVELQHVLLSGQEGQIKSTLWY